ncbi:hypothetical protein pEaSNUABM29_00011 [Erwinia phage pEa_SNUABM_29]|nr:hypothetical protein pEaSNUABM29_00011 [Erwinia phage pEa_SNUABM_29]
MLAGGRYITASIIPLQRVNAMSFTSKQNLLKLINEENKISPPLTFDDVDIGLPEVVSVDGRDSEVVLTSKMRGDEGSQVTVDYHRRPLEDYLVGNNVFGDEDVHTTHDLLTAINERFELNILPEDLEDNPVEGQTHTVVAVSLSHEWRSEAVIELKHSTPLAEVVTNTELNGLLYPDHQDTQLGQAYIYSRDIDCSHISRFLSLLAVGIEVDDTALAVELNKVVPEVWVAQDTPAPYNLRGATVVFDGVPADLVGANTEFAKVVSVALTDKCTNFQGNLNLHFNN